MTEKKSEKKASGKAEEPNLDTPAATKPEIHIFNVVGISPLLQNNPASFIGSKENADLAAGKKKYVDEEEALLRLYKDPEGNYCHPAEAFRKSMVRAVVGRKFGKMTATTAIQGSVFIVEPYALILDEDGELAKEYAIDRRSCVVGKARILRCRPCWPKWRMRVPLEIDTAFLAPSQVREALSLAGRIKGIGDYRPEKGGGFGRFKVE